MMTAAMATSIAASSSSTSGAPLHQTTSAAPIPLAHVELAEAIRGHRAARREILARAHAVRREDAAVQRQLEDALRGLRKLEAEFARFRDGARREIDAARLENARLTTELNALRAANARLQKQGAQTTQDEEEEKKSAAVTACNSRTSIEKCKVEQLQLHQSQQQGVKPFEKEISMTRLNKTLGEIPQEPAPRLARKLSSRGDRPFEPALLRRTFSKARRTSSGANNTAAENVHKRRSFSCSFSSHPRSSRADRPTSGKWSACF